jgi:hypothetical protein
MFIRQFCILSVILILANDTNAQPRPGVERKIQLLEQLRITQSQRIQLQELVQEEKLQQLWHSKRLQQILTPQQLKKLQQLRKEKQPVADTLTNKKNLP